MNFIILKGTASESERKAIAAALKKLSQLPKRMWAKPSLRKEMPSRWR